MLRFIIPGARCSPCHCMDHSNGTHVELRGTSRAKSCGAQRHTTAFNGILWVCRGIARRDRLSTPRNDVDLHGFPWGIPCQSDGLKWYPAVYHMNPGEVPEIKKCREPVGSPVRMQNPANTTRHKVDIWLYGESFLRRTASVDMYFCAKRFVVVVVVNKISGLSGLSGLSPGEIYRLTSPACELFIAVHDVQHRKLGLPTRHLG